MILTPDYGNEVHAKDSTDVDGGIKHSEEQIKKMFLKNEEEDSECVGEGAKQRGRMAGRKEGK